MSQTMTMANLEGTPLGSHYCQYDERDAILYALAVGSHATDLDLVYEKQLQVLPTYSLALGLWAVWACARLGAYDSARTLHVGQDLQAHKPLPRVGDFQTSATIGGVWDKGTAALVEVNVVSDYFSARYTIFVPDGGGFGGDRGPSSPVSVPNEEPNLRTRVNTFPDQAALYRLTGDLHPVHIDPSAAKAAGLGQPILHGLCTLGCTALAITLAGGHDPVSLSGLTARFSAPVLPGASIEIEAWERESGFAYVASVAEVGAVLTGTASYL
jgi:acyl dehydratase